MSRPLAAMLCLVLLGAAAFPHARGECRGDSYRVMRGDTLYSIARRCRGSLAAIAHASGLADARRIEVGQRLVIPRPGMRRAEAGKEEPAPRPAALAYRIAPGDTLFSLARWSRVGLPALLAANPGIDPRKIEIGDVVRLPAGAADPEGMRSRERGRGVPPPREVRREAPPAAPPADKPDEDDDEPEPEGM